MAGFALGDSEASSGSEGWHWRAGAEHPVRCQKGLQVAGGPGAAASLPTAAAAAETWGPKRARPWPALPHDGPRGCA